MSDRFYTTFNVSGQNAATAEKAAIGKGVVEHYRDFEGQPIFKVTHKSVGSIDFVYGDGTPVSDIYEFDVIDEMKRSEDELNAIAAKFGLTFYARGNWGEKTRFRVCSKKNRKDFDEALKQTGILGLSIYDWAEADLEVAFRSTPQNLTGEKNMTIARNTFGFLRNLSGDASDLNGRNACVMDVLADGRLRVHYIGNKRFYATVGREDFEPSCDAFWSEGSSISPEWEGNSAVATYGGFSSDKKQH